MANEEHLKILKQGVEQWNKWRLENPIRADLGHARLSGANLSDAYLSDADLSGADLSGANLSGARLSRAYLIGADLSGANLIGAKLSRADLSHAKLVRANLSGANLSGAKLRRANLIGANLSRAYMSHARLSDANLSDANLIGAKLIGASLDDADLSNTKLRCASLADVDLQGANLTSADLTDADLSRSGLVETDFTNATITGCRTYGASAWNVTLVGTVQHNLVITKEGEPVVTVDNIEVAQFIYLLLHNEKVRDAIDTIGKKGVLLLGRFTGGRIAVLERLREELRKRDFMPMVFNFDKPETKDFTETVRLLAGLSRFVIVDITNPRSAPLELQATVPEYMIPFVPILERGEEPFAMFRDLWIKHREWVLDPIRYPSVDRLIEVLDVEIVKPAQVRFAELLARKAEDLRIKDV
jgi:uncharacterized protein YjbI with pentapeptide repeats